MRLPWCLTVDLGRLGRAVKWEKWHLLLTSVLFLLPACAVEADWQFVSPMPHGRYWHDATLGHDGKIYVMGGVVFKWLPERGFALKQNDGEYSNLVYDPRNDTWKNLKPVPGWILVYKYMTYNAEKDIWYYHKREPGETISEKEIRNTDLEREGTGVAIATGKNGIIYWIGGKGKWIGHGEDIVLPYDPFRDAWPEAGHERVYYFRSAHGSAYGTKTIYKTNIPPMHDRRVGHEAVVLSNGKIYVMGGWQAERNEDAYGNVTGNGTMVLDTVECYDPETNKWAHKKPLKVKRMLFAAVVGPDDRIYVFGGAAGDASKRSTKTLATVEVYDPVADTWTSRNPMPAPRDSHAGILGADGKIYIMGGSTGAYRPPLKDVFIYDPQKDAWQKGPPMNLPRSSLAAVATPNGKIYAIGGTDVGAYKNRKKLNFFLPEKHELYEGKVQDTVEVLDISN